MPTMFHHHLQAWINSMPVTPGSRPLPPHFGGAMHCGSHPKYPLKFHQNDCWMTCHHPWLPQPTPSFFTLLFLAWPWWMHDLHSWFTWSLFQEGENRHKFQPNCEAHQPPIPLSPLQAMGSFVTQTTQTSIKKFALHQC